MPPFPGAVPDDESRALTADESEVPLKQKFAAFPEQKLVTSPVCCGCWRCRTPSATPSSPRRSPRSMARIDLLKALTNDRSVARDVRSGGLKSVERLDVLVVSKVVVDAQILLVVEAMIDSNRELILGVSRSRN